MFLEHLAGCCNVSAAAEATGMSERSVYTLRLRDDSFAAQWQAALSIGYARLEGLLIERAGGRADVPGGDVPAANASTLDPDLALQLLRQHRAGINGLPRPGGSQPGKADKQELAAAILRQLDLLNRRLRKRRGTC